MKPDQALLILERLASPLASKVEDPPRPSGDPIEDEIGGGT
jgi:hypothetical protein